MKTLTFYESVRVAINGFSEGAIDKQEAIEIIENAACTKCISCKNLETEVCTDDGICI